MNVERVDYFDTAGNLVHNYLPKPITIRPFGTAEAFVPAENTREEPGRILLSSGRPTASLLIRLSSLLWLAPSVRRASPSLVAASR